MGRILNQKTFQPTQTIRIDCVSEKTSMAFRHLATVYRNGVEVGYAKIPYQNRTWESYEFQSVMKRAVGGSSLNPQEKAEVNKWLDGDRTDWSGFQMTGMIAGLGDIFTKTPAESNAWKTRMLKAGLGNQGLDIPSDFGTLPEKTKTARLNAVINLISEKGKTKSRVRTKINKKSHPIGSANWMKKETGVFK